MARVTAEKVMQTRAGILEAARRVLHDQGYSGLTTRNVATAADVPLSQIQYHFGSKDGMVLALFEFMNGQLLERQNTMFADPNLSFSEKWALACDFLDTDIESGYVRVLQELTAVGWSNPEIGNAVRAGLTGWFELLSEQVELFLQTHDLDIAFSPKEFAALIGAAFLGAESSILLGLEERGMPYRAALRRFGELLVIAENKTEGGT